jgi:hypothetical protein
MFKLVITECPAFGLRRRGYTPEQSGTFESYWGAKAIVLLMSPYLSNVTEDFKFRAPRLWRSGSNLK